MSPSSAPEEFGAFSEERQRIERIVNRLDVTNDLIERADLGSELVRSISRYEDIFVRVILPYLEGSEEPTPEEIERDLEELREGMDEIHRRTMGIDARNVHASDGQGFEDTLEDVIARARALLLIEDREIAGLVEELEPDQRALLGEGVVHAFRHASERPHPPRTALGRLLSNAHVKLDHTLQDVATPHHPGAKIVKG